MTDADITVAYAVLRSLGGSEPYAASVLPMAEAMAPAVALLVKFHGTTAAVIEWMTTPHRELNEIEPGRLFLDGRGHIVVDMLEAAHAGIPS